MTAESIVNRLLETEWVPSPERRLCHHTWTTTATDETQPGKKIITQTCPTCGKQRILNRRILPKLPPGPKKPAVKPSGCRHIWGAENTEDSEGGLLRRYTHTCPKCGFIKKTVRRMLPKR